MSELFYTIKEPSEKHPSGLVIQISEKPASSKRVLYRETLLNLAKEEEKNLICFLIEEQLSYLGLSSRSTQASTTCFNEILIAAKRGQEALRKLSFTGRVLWKGKPLQIDLSPIALVYELSPLEGGELLVRGVLEEKTSPSGSWPIEECAAILPLTPPALIRNGSKDSELRVLDRPLGKKELLLIYPQPTTLSGKKKEDFLDELEEGSFRWKKTPQEPLPVWPILKLKDATGGFADLWIDYGLKGKWAVHDPSSFPGRLLSEEKQWEKDLLETGFRRKPLENSQYYCPLDQVVESLTFLLEIGWTVLDAQGRKVLRQTGKEAHAQTSGQKILFHGCLFYEEHPVALDRLIHSLQKKEAFVSLDKYTVGLIDTSRLEREWKGLLSQEIVEGGVAMAKSHFGLLEGILREQEGGIALKEDLFLTQIGRPRAKALPSDLFKGVLRAYQQEGVDWLSFLYEEGFGGLLADEMGLGKTVQVLAFLSRLELARPLLIVAPTTLLFQWQKEIERFLEASTVYLHRGRERINSPEKLRQKSFILTSYALLRYDQDLFCSLDYEAIILDEAQAIKNPESQIAQSAFSLQGRFKLALTGTPIENQWQDLWALFHFLMPSLLGGRKEFTVQMLRAEGGDLRYQEEVAKKLRPFILRRHKSAVLQQLPPKEEQLIWVEMGEHERALYESTLSQIRSRVLPKIEKEGLVSQRMALLEGILRLRQLCCHPLLVGSSIQEPTGKLERLLEDLETVVMQRSKVLIYSQFTEMLRLIEKKVQERQWAYVYLDGQSSDREESVRKFQEDPDVFIFLISLKAGGVGLNLTAADYIFLFDPWWNDAVEQQAIGRAHRMGRSRSVIARRYLVTESIEEKILQIKEKKKSLMHCMQGLLTSRTTEAIGEGGWAVEELYELIL